MILWKNENIDFNKKYLLTVILRIRNEELIIKDTLTHISEFADIICVYDDASTDNTLNLVKSFSKVALVIENKVWQSNPDDRVKAETSHRSLLLNIMNEHIKTEWVMCCDADERYIGNIREFLLSEQSNSVDGVRIQLFDAYMTPTDNSPYISGPLLNFRKFYGPESRNILMIWKNSPTVKYVGLDKREPNIVGKIIVNFLCQHYGKSLSVDHWEETCDYYSTYFPMNLYGSKWLSRKGKGIHDKSDFNSDLYEWGDQLFNNKKII